MLARSLAILGLGISLAVAAPVAAFAQAKPQTIASVEAKKPIVKKKAAAKAKPDAKKVAKAKVKNAKNKKAKPSEEEVVEKKPRGLFATLFGGPVKSADDQKAEKVKLAQAKKRPLRKPVAPLPPLEPLQVEPVALTPEASEVVSNGNNGELRSDNVQAGGFMASIFGAEDQMLPQTRALDGVQKKKDQKKKFRVKSEFEPQVVAFDGYPRGTIVIDTNAHFLYLVESFGTARRYGIAVGRDGLQYKGNVKVGDKQEWPRWIPTLSHGAVCFHHRRRGFLPRQRLASAALGALLQARGYRVRLRKLDPYLNVDPGTMSPYQHGEVFVTDDGAETDLDLGHYERFTGRSANQARQHHHRPHLQEHHRQGAARRLSRRNRAGDPARHRRHQELSSSKATRATISCLCEIGGTVGDIEAMPFLEAIRQFGNDLPRGQCVYVHLTLMPYIPTAGELKTKPTQHSVKELRSIGISRTFCWCRADRPIPEEERRKLSLFCNVRESAVIQALDVGHIYDVPLAYHKEGLDSEVLAAFGIDPAPKPRMERWKEISTASTIRRAR
jgi:lipoprotein-anchoring transpeptidase ErfK/SrfK